MEARIRQHYTDLIDVGHISMEISASTLHVIVVQNLEALYNVM